MKSTFSVLACLAAFGAASDARAQDSRPPTSTPPETSPRPIDPGGAPPAVSPPTTAPPATTTDTPLPPLPPAAPSEPARTDAPPPPPPPPHERPRRPRFGGLGYVSVGPFFGDLSTLDTALRSPDALGASYGIGRAGMTFGGGGGAVLFGHLWLGGKGFGLLTAPFVNARGEAILVGGGGGFELGYVLTSYVRTLVIPFFSIGGYRYDLGLTNKSGRPLLIQDAFSLSAGETRHFHANFMTLELGLRLHRLLFTRHGGFIGGFELGMLRSLSAATWKSERYELVDHGGAIIDGVYARITFGGGGFSFR